MPRIPGPRSDGRSHHKHTGVVVLAAEGPKLKAPTLPAIGRAWHPMTRAWWSDATSGLWASPMASELARADVHGLFRLAALVDDYWTAEGPKDRAKISGEVRLLSATFGLDPISRRKLGWRFESAPKRPVNRVEEFLRQGREADHDGRDCLR